MPVPSWPALSCDYFSRLIPRLERRFPQVRYFQSFVLELILTALLMFVILGVSTGAREKGITAGIVVGSVIGLEAMFAGPICGASMNPARSLAPGRRQPPSAKPLDLSAGAHHWRTSWSSRLPLRPRTRLLLVEAERQQELQLRQRLRLFRALALRLRRAH